MINSPTLQEFGIYLGASVLITMVTEYLVHRWVMHKLFWPFKPYAVLREHQRAHAGDHHSLGDNSLELVDLPLRNWLFWLLPIELVLYWISPWFFLTFAGVCFVHSVIWTTMHRASHDLGFLYLKDLPVFKFLIKHHLGHHLDPSKNYGTVYGPIMDIVFRTRYVPKS